MTDVDAERQRREDATVAILAESIIENPQQHTRLEREVACSDEVEATVERIIADAELHPDHVLTAAQRVRQAIRLDRMAEASDA